MQSWFDQWAALLSSVPEEMALAALLLPVVLAIFSKRVIVVLGSFLLALLALCAFVAPTNMAVTLVTGSYFGSLMVALSGIFARRRAEAIQAEFSRLRSDVNELLAAENRRFLLELKSSTAADEQSAGVSTTVKPSAE
jgi:hypothetical protein